MITCVNCNESFQDAKGIGEHVLKKHMPKPGALTQRERQAVAALKDLRTALSHLHAQAHEFDQLTAKSDDRFQTLMIRVDDLLASVRTALDALEGRS